MSDLLTTPLFWMTVTFLVFEGADRISKRSNRHPLFHPVLWATPVMMLLLVLTRTPYATYISATSRLLAGKPGRNPGRA